MTNIGLTPWRKIPNPDDTYVICDNFGITMADNVHPDIAGIIVRSVNLFHGESIRPPVTALDD